MLQNQITGIIAPKGSGKTHLATQLASNEDRVVIFDLVAEEQWADIADDIIVGSPAQFASALHANHFKIVYRPLRYDTRTLECEGFNWFCKLAYLRGDLLMVVDEAHQLCTPHNIPDALRITARLGRHRKVSLLYITQSFTQIERTLTLNTNTFHFFKVIDPRDLEGIRQRCGLQVADRVQALRRLDAKKSIPGEVLTWQDSGDIGEVDLGMKKDLTAKNTSDTDKNDEQGKSAGSAGGDTNLRIIRAGDQNENRMVGEHGHLSE